MEALTGRINLLLFESKLSSLNHYKDTKMYNRIHRCKAAWKGLKSETTLFPVFTLFSFSAFASFLSKQALSPPQSYSRA